MDLVNDLKEAQTDVLEIKEFIMLRGLLDETSVTVVLLSLDVLENKLTFLENKLVYLINKLNKDKFNIT